MDYYTLLDFKIEPFSNTPDPRLFYHSRQHLEILQKLEISLRLKRGLNVVMGDVGHGKTTISRQLIQKLSQDKAIEYYLILDPGFKSAQGSLIHILTLFTGKELGKAPGKNLNENHLKEQIKKHLFQQGVDQNINTILIIDEGQKLSLEILEVLRELLNFETNDKKLLQIVIFAQNEFHHSLNQVKNFQDRISFRYHLKALNFKESTGLIQYRLNQSFVLGKERPVFSTAAFMAIYAATQGSPRKIVHLCHQVILSLIIQSRKKAGFFLVRSCVKETALHRKSRQIPVLATGILVVCFLAAGFFLPGTQDLPKDSSPVPRTTPDLPVHAALIAETVTPEDSMVPALSDPAPPVSTGSEIVPSNQLSLTSLPEKAIPSTPTDFYGSILVSANTTISHMITLVYGRFSPKLLDRLMASNNTISDPDRISVGIPIRFPVLQEEKQYPDPMIFLVILQTRDFNLAFSEAASTKYWDLDVRILPFQLQDKGYIFNLIINKAFDTREKALAFLEKIKPEVMAVPETVVSLKTKEFNG